MSTAKPPPPKRTSSSQHPAVRAARAKMQSIADGELAELAELGKELRETADEWAAEEARERTTVPDR